MMWGSSAGSKLTKSRLKDYLQIIENQLVRRSSSFHNVNMRNKKRKTKNGATYSTLHPWWCLDTQLTQSSPKSDWPLIDTSPKIKIWDTLLVLISSICETKLKTKTVLCIPPFILDNAWKLSSLKTHQKQIDHSSIPHRQFQNETPIQFSYRQYAKKL